MIVAYFDAFSGISGDMAVGALIALGLPIDHLRSQLSRLDLGGYTIRATQRQVHGIQAIKFDVDVEPAEHHAQHDHSSHHHHRTFRDIRALIERSGLDPAVCDTALRIFTRLAEAEGRVHGMDADAVTFHEVGAVDSIVDIVGTAIGIQHFGIARAYVSPLSAGSGTVSSEHGPLPVPPPATVELLKGFQLRLGDGAGELVTPTGAAIVAALADPSTPPPLQVRAVGYGAGTRRLEDRPNLLRLLLGEVDARLDHDHMVVIETNIDDTNPEIYEFVFDRLFGAGAKDVFLSPIQMKKSRPGVLLSVLCEPAHREQLAAIILSETSAIGVRHFGVERLKLPRETVTVATEYGDVRVKVAQAPDGRENVAPEYDDCARVARERQVPLKLVYQAAVAAYLGSKHR